MLTGLLLVLFALVSFVQNMAFTFSSRSRNSGDPYYHRYAAWGSNGIWLLNQLFLVKVLWKPVLDNNNYLWVAIAGVVYIISTTEGSVYMMKVMLGKTKTNFITKHFVENKKRHVGSR